MWWNFPDCDTVDVAVRALAEILFVGLLGVFIPVARPYTATSGALEADSESADSAE
jgi:hypothetical protein